MNDGFREVEATRLRVALELGHPMGKRCEDALAL
jgi:hypothetical protein